MHKTILAAALAVIGRCRRQRGGGGSDAYLRREFTDIKISPGAST
jgi:hypothetical protein